MENREKIAKSLSSLRTQYGLSQSELSRKTGISQAKISRWEAGINLPSILDCIVLAEFYEITLDELVGKVE
ncbi:MAG: helix-turn-helix domain-containing protein [Clostridia bacterium]|nr:helix-turn-helix domain-containing protein [Clostridia bacterium]